MKIAVVGLGLIGGSFCKSIKKYTDHRVFGIDRDPDTVKDALACGAIEEEILPARLKEMDLTIVCLHPRQTMAFIEEHADKFRTGSLVIDSCGVKESIVQSATVPLAARGVTFVGCHPMAGREFSGFAYSLDSLYENASFIITPTSETPSEAVDFLTKFAKKFQFGKVVTATPLEHDRVIAFPSQLAHVVSSAYIKSPSLEQEVGFSAGSFLDLTRVAKLNEDMWTDLFLLNRGPLVEELDTIIRNLTDYRDAIDSGAHDQLKAMLRDGRIRKEESLKKGKSK